MTNDFDDPLIRPSEAARRIGVSAETVWRWLRKGAITYEQIGPFRRKMIRRSVVDAQRTSVPRESDTLNTSDNMQT
jgi:excisionase family DNA binding protein